MKLPFDDNEFCANFSFDQKIVASLNKENNIKQGSIDESEDTKPNTENTPQKSESEKAASTEDEKIGDLNQAAVKEDTRKDSRASNETVSTQQSTMNRAEKRGILSKSAFSIVIMFAAVAVLFAFNSQWKFRLNEVLDEYIPETKKYIIRVENIPWRSPENIWNEKIHE